MFRIIAAKGCCTFLDAFFRRGFPLAKPPLLVARMNPVSEGCKINRRGNLLFRKFYQGMPENFLWLLVAFYISHYWGTKSYTFKAIYGFKSVFSSNVIVTLRKITREEKRKNSTALYWFHLCGQNNNNENPPRLITNSKTWSAQA